MKVGTRAALLVGLVFLVGTVFGGLVGARIALRQLGLVPPAIEGPPELPAGPGPGGPRQPRPGEGRPFQGPGGPGQRSPNAALNRMIRNLELDETQSARVRKVLQESRQKQMAANGRHQELSRKIRLETLEEIQAVLTPEQAEQFQRMVRRLNEAQRRNREHRPF